jgi:hypothetical protein
MVYVFFVIACLCSNYMIAMQPDKQQGSSIITDKESKNREALKKDMSDEIYVGVPCMDANDQVVGFMSLPISQARPINEAINKRLAEKNKDNK